MAAGVALAVEVWVRDATGGIQLMAVVVYMAALVFSSVGGYGEADGKEEKVKKIRRKIKGKRLHVCTLLVPACLGVGDGGRDARSPKLDTG